MSVQVIIPKLGFSMEEGQLVSWLVEDGARVEAGAPLFELETDKSITEVEAPASGTLRQLAATDENYLVGTVIGEILP